MEPGAALRALPGDDPVCVSPRPPDASLKRVGERGEGKWQEISWEEAFDLIEKRLGDIREEYGPESVVFSMGTGRDISSWLCMLAYAYGSPNVMFALSGNACYSPRIAAVETVLGDYCVPDAAQWLEKRYDDPRYRVPEVHRDLGLQHSQHLPRQHFRPLVHRSDEARDAKSSAWIRG